jgi:hypothetical protein
MLVGARPRGIARRDGRQRASLLERSLAVYDYDLSLPWADP